MELWKGGSHVKEELKPETVHFLVTKSDCTLILGFILGAGNGLL